QVRVVRDASHAKVHANHRRRRCPGAAAEWELRRMPTRGRRVAGVDLDVLCVRQTSTNFPAEQGEILTIAETEGAYGSVGTSSDSRFQESAKLHVGGRTLRRASRCVVEHDLAIADRAQIDDSATESNIERTLDLRRRDLDMLRCLRRSSSS